MMNRRQAMALIAAKAALGASLALGMVLGPAGHAKAAMSPKGDIATQGPVSDQCPLAVMCWTDSHNRPWLVIDQSGGLRDCTVTDRAGRRADQHVDCDAYWESLR